VTVVAEPTRDLGRSTGRAGWAITALALGGFGIGTTEFATMGILPDVGRDLSVSVATSGQLVSAYALGVVVGAPVLAVLGARLPRKALLLALLTATAVGNALSSLAPGFGSLLVARFLTGLPHGAFFGVGSLVAASLVPPERRGRAVARVMLGLMVANLVGVPLATVLGQHLGWRSTYEAVAVMGVLAVAGIARLVPAVPAVEGASARTELSALRRPQVLLALAVGAVGFGGFFAVYSYISPILTHRAGFSEPGIPVALALIGLGMTLGTEIGGRLADRSVLGTLALCMAANGLVLAVFPLTARTPVTAGLTLLAMTVASSSCMPALTARLLDVAGDAQSLAASGMHAALNIANAAGAALGGVVLAAGLGYGAPPLVGAGLSAGGLLVLGGSVALQRRAAP
jgi:DHA1 family inner membrane transport protein